jgi:hypothetical protein
MSDFKQYMLKQEQKLEMRTYVPAEDMTNIVVSAYDTAAGSPKAGDMIARNPQNPNGLTWLIAAAYFTANYKPTI